MILLHTTRAPNTHTEYVVQTGEHKIYIIALSQLHWIFIKIVNSQLLLSDALNVSINIYLCVFTGSRLLNQSKEKLFSKWIGNNTVLITIWNDVRNVNVVMIVVFKLFHLNRKINVSIEDVVVINLAYSTQKSQNLELRKFASDQFDTHKTYANSSAPHLLTCSSVCQIAFA